MFWPGVTLSMGPCNSVLALLEPPLELAPELPEPLDPPELPAEAFTTAN